MMYAYSRIEYDDELMHEFIENEMHKVKGQALRKLSSIVVHFNSEISTILAYSWFDSIPAAQRLAEHLDLTKIDLLAIQEDLEGFKKEFLRDQYNWFESYAS